MVVIIGAVNGWAGGACPPLKKTWGEEYLAPTQLFGRDILSDYTNIIQTYEQLVNITNNLLNHTVIRNFWCFIKTSIMLKSYMYIYSRTRLVGTRLITYNRLVRA